MQGVEPKNYCSASGGGSICVCVCVYACGFGRLKVTVVALLRPAHLPQSVSNQSCSVKRAAPVISECVSRRARAHLALSCHFTCICIDRYIFSKEVLVVQLLAARSSIGCAGLTHYHCKSNHVHVWIPALSFQLMSCVCGTSKPTD